MFRCKLIKMEGECFPDTLGFIREVFDDTLKERNEEKRQNEIFAKQYQLLKEQFTEIEFKFKSDNVELNRREEENKNLVDCRTELLRQIDEIGNDLAAKEEKIIDLENCFEEIKKQKRLNQKNRQLLQVVVEENEQLKKQFEKSRRGIQKLEREGEIQLEELNKPLEKHRQCNKKLCEKRDCLEESLRCTKKNYEEAKCDFDNVCDRVVQCKREVAALKCSVAKKQHDLSTAIKEVEAIQGKKYGHSKCCPVHGQPKSPNRRHQKCYPCNQRTVQHRSSSHCRKSSSTCPNLESTRCRTSLNRCGTCDNICFRKSGNMRPTRSVNSRCRRNNNKRCKSFNNRQKGMGEIKCRKSLYGCKHNNKHLITGRRQNKHKT